MSFWESKVGAAAGVLVIGWVVVIALAGVRVYLATHPERQTAEDVDFHAMRVPVDPVEFTAVDGVRLSGWMIEADADHAPVLLCHDVGSSKQALLSLAIALNDRGHPVLMFDFRGHGDSAGQASTLGLTEKRDILGALDYLAERRGGEPTRVGIYGVGMGAHAAVLAAADRPALRVLVLDGLYPDACYPLVREVFAGWTPGVQRLAFLPTGLFTVMNRVRIGEHRAADALPLLARRELLLLAPAGDADLTSEIRRMVASIPDRPDLEGNMIVLPVTQTEGLYGENLDRHRHQVATFFDERLASRTARAAVGP